MQPLLTKQRFPLALITVLCVVVLFWSHKADAQESHPSHRKLQLPQGGNSNAQQQIQLIKQLQTLMKNRTTQPNESEGFSDSQKSLMKKMLDQFKDSQQMPDLSDIPPDLLSKVLADPKARQDAAEMLKQFQKDRQLPSSNGQSGLPMPPKTGERSGTDPRQQSRAQPNATPNQTSPPNSRDDVRPPPYGNDSRSMPRSSNPNSRPTPKEQNNSDRRTSPAGTETPPRQLPNESNDAFEDRFMEYLDKQIRRQRRNGETRELAPTEIPETRPTIPNRPGTQRSDRSLAPQRGPGPERKSGDNSEQFDSSSSISDLLKNLEGLPPLPKTSNESKSAEAQAKERLRTEQQQTRESEQLRLNREKARRDLERGGLGSAMKKILKDSKSEIEKAAKSSGGRPSPRSRDTNSNQTSPQISPGLQDTIIRSLDGLTEDLVDIVKDGEFKTRKPSNKNSAKQSNRRDSSRGQNSKGKNSSESDGWSKQASDFFSDITKPNDGEPQTPGDSETASETAAQQSPTSVSLIPFLALAVIALFVLAIAWKTGAITPESILTRGENFTMPKAGLRNRKDVVRAFHQFARQPQRDTQSWWTHQQVTELVGHQEPENREPVEVLASVYEHARYMPDDAELKKEQLDAAQTALDRCRS